MVEDLIGVEGAWKPWSERPDRRFAHQLRRWVALGAPQPPPLEAWPPNAFSPGLIEVPDQDDRARHKEQQRARREAVAAVHAALAQRRNTHPGNETRSIGDADEADWVADALLGECTSRGVPMTRGRALQLSQGLALTGKSLGRLRTSVWALRQMPETARALLGAANAIRASIAQHDGGEEASEDTLEGQVGEVETGPWPDNAFFDDNNDDETAWVEVRLDPDAGRALRTMATEATGKVREFTRPEVWLRPNPTDPDAAIEVGAGVNSVVGYLDPGSTAHTAFATAVRAATAFDELVVARGELRWVERPAGRALALRPPRTRWEPPVGMR